MTPPDPPFLLHMNDALAASALVAAILAAFLSIWQVEIQDALALKESNDPANWEATRIPIRQALWRRAVPLCVICVITCLVLALRAIRIGLNVAACGPSCEYDDVQALFVLTEVLILGLSLLAGAQVYRLIGRLRKLAPRLPASPTAS